MKYIHNPFYVRKYYTHRPYLIEELKSSPKRILEFGTGIGSAKILHAYAKKNPNVRIEAFENDQQWLEKMKHKYSLPNYVFNYVASWEDDVRFDGSYDLAFIDSAPWDSRIKMLELVKNKASTIIIHDFDYFGNIWEKYEGIFNVIPHTEKMPPTLVLKKK